jgi:cytidylate kinase
MIIAIDGPAGSGKSSTAKLVAQRLGILYLDTGAMYRAITLMALRKKIVATDDRGLADLVAQTTISFTGAVPNVRVLIDNVDVSDAIRGDEVTRNVSDYCMPAVVRTALVTQQRRIAGSRSIVCDGRDIGTVVFPDAPLKFFMVASVAERAKRRQLDFQKLGITKSIADIEAEIIERDRKDSTRELSPLVRAADAEEIDTTQMTLDEQVRYIVEKVMARGFSLSAQNINP